MQPHPEHQQDDPDLGQFRREGLIGDEAGCEGADHDARHQIADEWRDPQAVGQRAHQEGQDKTPDDGGDQRRMVQHA